MSTEEIVNLVMRDRRLVIKSKSPRGSITAVLWNRSKSKGLFVSAGPSRHKLAPGIHIPDADCGVADEDAYDPPASPPAAAAGVQDPPFRHTPTASHGATAHGTGALEPPTAAACSAGD